MYPTTLLPASPLTEPTSYPSYTLRSTVPSESMSGLPSNNPSGIPSNCPSSQPSLALTMCLTSIPSDLPSAQLTENPTTVSSGKPLHRPYVVPSNMPSSILTTQPSTLLSGQPSPHHTGKPSVERSSQPSSQPSSKPSTRMPTSWPTILQKTLLVAQFSNVVKGVEKNLFRDMYASSFQQAISKIIKSPKEQLSVNSVNIVSVTNVNSVAGSSTSLNLRNSVVGTRVIYRILTILEIQGYSNVNAALDSIRQQLMSASHSTQLVDTINGILSSVSPDGAVPSPLTDIDSFEFYPNETIVEVLIPTVRPTSSPTEVPNEIHSVVTTTLYIMLSTFILVIFVFIPSIQYFTSISMKHKIRPIADVAALAPPTKKARRALMLSLFALSFPMFQVSENYEKEGFIHCRSKSFIAICIEEHKWLKCLSIFNEQYEVSYFSFTIEAIALLTMVCWSLFLSTILISQWISGSDISFLILFDLYGWEMTHVWICVWISSVVVYECTFNGLFYCFGPIARQHPKGLVDNRIDSPGKKRKWSAHEILNRRKIVPREARMFYTSGLRSISSVSGPIYARVTSLQREIDKLIQRNPWASNQRARALSDFMKMKYCEVWGFDVRTRSFVKQRINGSHGSLRIAYESIKQCHDKAEKDFAQIRVGSQALLKLLQNKKNAHFKRYLEEKQLLKFGQLITLSDVFTLISEAQLVHCFILDIQPPTVRCILESELQRYHRVADDFISLQNNENATVLHPNLACCITIVVIVLGTLVGSCVGTVLLCTKEYGIADGNPKDQLYANLFLQRTIVLSFTLFLFIDLCFVSPITVALRKWLPVWSCGVIPKVNISISWMLNKLHTLENGVDITPYDANVLIPGESHFQGNKKRQRKIILNAANYFFHSFELCRKLNLKNSFISDIVRCFHTIWPRERLSNKQEVFCARREDAMAQWMPKSGYWFSICLIYLKLPLVLQDIMYGFVAWILVLALLLIHVGLYAGHPLLVLVPIGIVAGIYSVKCAIMTHGHFSRGVRISPLPPNPPIDAAVEELNFFQYYWLVVIHGWIKHYTNRRSIQPLLSATAVCLSTDLPTASDHIYNIDHITSQHRELLEFSDSGGSDSFEEENGDNYAHVDSSPSEVSEKDIVNPVATVHSPLLVEDTARSEVESVADVEVDHKEAAHIKIIRSESEEKMLLDLRSDFLHRILSMDMENDVDDDAIKKVTKKDNDMVVFENLRKQYLQL